MARRKTQIDPEHFYTVHNWMLTELGLSKTDLLIYAFIFSYSTNKNGKGCYFGGYEAMSLSVGCGTKSTQNIVNKLCKAMLIEKKSVTYESGATRNYIRTSVAPLNELAEYVQGLDQVVAVLQSFDPVWNDLQKVHKKICNVKGGDRVF